MSEHMSPIPSRIYNAAVGGHVCGPEDLDFGQKVVHLIKYDRAGNEVSFESQVTQANKIYVIHDDFVLSSNVTIPANCVLEFDGGSISNGTITGSQTKIVAPLCNIFNNIVIAGTWLVSDIYSDWFPFTDSSIETDMKAVTNLTIDCPDEKEQNVDLFKFVIHHNIYINKDLNWTPSANGVILILLKRPTDLYMTGTIKMMQNNLNLFKMVNIVNTKDVTIHGGKFVGDIDEHIYDDGYDYGYPTWEPCNGVYVWMSHNITLVDCEISHFPGDGLYFGGGGETSDYDFKHACKNIVVKNCYIHHNGACNTSLAGSVEGCIYDNCEISYAGNSTSAPRGPWSGFDIEVNYSNDTVKDVTIRNCRFVNTLGTSFIIAQRALLENLTVENCYFEGSKTLNSYNALPINIGGDCYKGKNIVFRNNIIEGNVMCQCNAQVQHEILYENCVITGGVTTEGGNGVLTTFKFKQCSFTQYPQAVVLALRNHTNISFDDCSFTGDLSRGAITLWFIANTNACLYDKLNFVNCRFKNIIPNGTIIKNCVVEISEAVPSIDYGSVITSNDNDYVLEDNTFIYTGSSALDKIIEFRGNIKKLEDVTNNLLIKRNKFIGNFNTNDPIRIDRLRGLANGTINAVIEDNDVFGKENMAYALYQDLYTAIAGTGTITVNRGSKYPIKSGTTQEITTMTSKCTPLAGDTVFDSTRGKSIVNNGTTWVNMDGSSLT